MDKLENIKKMKKEIEKWNVTLEMKYFYMGKYIFEEIE